MKTTRLFLLPLLLSVGTASGEGLPETLLRDVSDAGFRRVVVYPFLGENAAALPAGRKIAGRIAESLSRAGLESRVASGPSPECGVSGRDVPVVCARYPEVRRGEAVVVGSYSLSEDGKVLTGLFARVIDGGMGLVLFERERRKDDLRDAPAGTSCAGLRDALFRLQKETMPLSARRWAAAARDEGQSAEEVCGRVAGSIKDSSLRALFYLHVRSALERKAPELTDRENRRLAAAHAFAMKEMERCSDRAR